MWTNEGSPLRGDRAAPGARRCASASGRTSASITRCATAIPGIAAAIDAHDRGRAARASSPRRSIRNIARRRRRPRTTRCSPRWRAMRWQPALRTLPPYYDDPLYIDALRGEPRRGSSTALDFEPERLLLSFHGMPQRTLELGDPYHCHCQKTARLLSRSARPRGRRRLPVALRPRQMARAGDRRDARRLSRRAASRASRSPRRAFPPIAWRRWRSSASAAARRSCAPAASISRCSIASTIRPKAWPCSNA